MAGHNLSYVRLPEDLGGGIVEASRTELSGGGYSYSIGYQGSKMYSGHADGKRSFTLVFDEPLEEIAPPEPTDGSTMFGPSDNDLIGVYRRIDATSSQLGAEFHWWAAGLDEPMRWPQVWHRSGRNIRHMQVDQRLGSVLTLEE